MDFSFAWWLDNQCLISYEQLSAVKASETRTMHNYKMKDPPNQRKYKEQFKDYFYYVES
jgi:hypothetical protein